MGSPFVGEGEFFTSAIQLRKCASSTIIQVLQRGAAAEDAGEGLSGEVSIGSRSVTDSALCILKLIY